MDDYENESLPVGEAQVAEAMQTLQRYKAGKAALDKRIVDNEELPEPHDARQGSALQRMAVQQHCQQACGRHGQLPGAQRAAPVGR